MAKEFAHKVFSGTISARMKDENWWHVEYDDGDQEDLDKKEVTRARKLYMYYRHAEP